MGKMLASPPSMVCHAAMMLSGPPTRKQPGHRSSATPPKLIHRPSSAMTSSRSSQLSSAAPDEDNAGGVGQEGHARKVGEGSANWRPTQDTSKASGLTVAE